MVPDPRTWVSDLRSEGGDDEDEEMEEDNDDWSLDLLVRFLHNVFHKIPRHARRAVRERIIVNGSRVSPVRLKLKMIQRLC